MDAWQRRDVDVLRLANEKFRKLGVEEQRTMVAAIRDDEQRLARKEV
jgi:hypothetical protein